MDITPAADTPAGPPTTTTRQDLVTSILGLWLMIGLFVDGWAHVNLSQLETFFTPWHALFYSGFTAVAGWTAWLVGVRRATGLPRWDSIPAGYHLGVVGAAVFAVGGVGDWMWHTIFGIETSLDALLSPTHLLLFAGMVLVVTSPLRAIWYRHEGRALAWADGRPAILSTALVTLLIAFFFLYAWAPTSGLLQAVYSPFDELAVSYGVLEFVVTTVILMGPAAMLVSRFDLPVGAFTFMAGTVGVLMNGIEAFDQPWEFVAPLMAGVTLDAFARLGMGPAKPVVTRVAFMTAPVVMWLTHVASFALLRSIGWTPEIWGGAVLFGGLAGVGLSLLAVPYRPQATSN
jgi:hypothetical protein